MGFKPGHFFSALAGLIIGGMLVAVLPAGAGNGDPIYLGQANTAKATTRISVNYGMVIRSFRADVPAATFKVASGAPIAVNSAEWVENLNADLLDGVEAAAFAPSGHTHASSPLVIPAAAFAQDGGTNRDEYTFDGGMAIWPIDLDSDGTFRACLVAPVYLPDGATVTRFGAKLYDDDSDGRLEYARLGRRARTAIVSAYTMAEVSTTDSYAYHGVATPSLSSNSSTIS